MKAKQNWVKEINPIRFLNVFTDTLKIDPANEYMCYEYFSLGHLH